MALRKKRIPRYGTVQVNGHKYYRTDVEDAEGKRVILYGKTREELYDKEMGHWRRLTTSHSVKNPLLSQSIVKSGCLCSLSIFVIRH